MLGEVRKITGNTNMTVYNKKKKVRRERGRC